MGGACSFASPYGIQGLMRLSAVMTGQTQRDLTSHLLRDDGQEDLCFITWRPSNGRRRQTSIIGAPILPRAGDREVHGNASFRPKYALRAAQEAAQLGSGLAFAHSHPEGRGWQRLNEVDRTAEEHIANLARELTGLPLLGLILAGDTAWSGRLWVGAGKEVAPLPLETVRVIGEDLSVSFHDVLAPVPRVTQMQERTLHTWGPVTQATIARLRVAVAGVGSVGMAVAELLARTGIQCMAIFDFDTVEWVNIDRLRGAGALDAYLARAKVDIARRVLAQASTAVNPRHEFYELSICEPEGFARLLDCDLIFSCVDRPWARHVLNTIAYTDLIPVIEGGMVAFNNPDQSFRNAYWSSTVVRPGRPCLVCLGQYDPSLVQVERDGSLEDPSYIANLPADSPLRRRENVAALSASVTSALLRQFICFVARPSGFGDLGPLRFSSRDHKVEKGRAQCEVDCPYPANTGVGEARLAPAAPHPAAERARRERASVSIKSHVGRRLDDLAWTIRDRLSVMAGRSLR